MTIKMNTFPRMKIENEKYLHVGTLIAVLGSNEHVLLVQNRDVFILITVRGEKWGTQQNV